MAKAALRAKNSSTIPAIEPGQEKPNLGLRLRSIRRERDLTLDQVSKLTGLSISSLSKVENGLMSLTYDNLVRLASGLGIDVADLFITDRSQRPMGRRSVTRSGGGDTHDTSNYAYELLSTDIAPKAMVPMLVRLKANSMNEFGDPLRHEGEEFIYVLEGEVTVHLEAYAPVKLKPGDSIYIDSRLGHAYLNAGPKPALILGICSQTALSKIGSDDI